MERDLISIIKEDIKTAMKSKNSIELETLRSVLDTIQKKMLCVKSNKEITDEIVIDCVNKNIKQREESIVAYAKANREDLVNKERTELEILNRYRPIQMGEEEVKKIVIEIIDKLDKSLTIGLKMKSVMTHLKGKADGSLISRIVKEQLK